MKYMHAIILTMAILVTAPAIAADLFEALREQIVRLGDIIENADNIPLVNKLTNVLPFAVAKTCLQECPGQTMVVFGGILVYLISKNESVRSLVRKYNIFNTHHKSLARLLSQQLFDDTLFIFEGDDEDDAQDQEDAEDDLLNGSSDDIRQQLNQMNKKTLVTFL